MCTQWQGACSALAASGAQLPSDVHAPPHAHAQSARAPSCLCLRAPRQRLGSASLLPFPRTLVFVAPPIAAHGPACAAMPTSVVAEGSTPGCRCLWAPTFTCARQVRRCPSPAATRVCVEPFPSNGRSDARRRTARVLDPPARTGGRHGLKRVRTCAWMPHIGCHARLNRASQAQGTALTLQ